MKPSTQARLTVGRFLHGLRVRRGLSLRKLGRATGMSATYISRIENGTYLFPAQYTQDFVKALGISGKEQHVFYDMLSIARENRFEDIDEYLSRNSQARYCIRLIMLQEDPASVWDQILQLLNDTKR